MKHCLTASALVSFIHSPIKYGPSLPCARHCAGHWRYTRIVYGPCLQGSPLVSSGPAWHPKAALGNGITIPFAAGKSGSRGLAKCQATGFPKVKLDVRERSQPGSNRHQGGNQGPKGRRVQRTRRAEDSAAVAGLGAERPRALLPGRHRRCGDNDDPWARVS